MIENKTQSSGAKQENRNKTEKVGKENIRKTFFFVFVCSSLYFCACVHVFFNRYLKKRIRIFFISVCFNIWTFLFDLLNDNSTCDYSDAFFAFVVFDARYSLENLQRDIILCLGCCYFFLLFNFLYSFVRVCDDILIFIFIHSLFDTVQNIISQAVKRHQKL